MRIFGLYPFNKNTHHPNVDWTLWLFDKCISIPECIAKHLTIKHKFGLSYMTDERCFYWVDHILPANSNSDDDDEPHHFKIINSPWYRERYKEEIYTNNGWVEWEQSHLSPLSWEEWWAGRTEAQKTITTKFYMYENDEKIPVDVTITGETNYYGHTWLPQYLKFLNHVVKRQIWIEFSTDIGRGRGSWKGGTKALAYPFTESLEKSYLEFELNELPKYLEKRK